ncbi:unnamed protein product [Didymodactylos carnosus]|uniref:Nucleoporin 88 n=1 Tax=Didymodactylos carnosus TaxID=1234261 RepID=A0A813PDB2_9BILA|nr:unnamed protein product [Didymodactylos carnosus]CAF0748772.1 unnamed protein product [Didymodactylos carnosus]CAF3507479.1 unnamed protein product [Didymodactylos carnosus]CAF3527991.1 unnamed protein product [Didymodactylos carnosus]
MCTLRAVCEEKDVSVKPATKLIIILRSFRNKMFSFLPTTVESYASPSASAKVSPLFQSSTNSFFSTKPPPTNVSVSVNPSQTSTASDFRQPTFVSESTTMISTSLPHSIRLLLSIPNVSVYTFGETYLIGYCHSEHCLYVYQWNKLFSSKTMPDKITTEQCQRLHLSSSPAWSIQRLLLNKNETILTMLAEKVAYIIHLPPYLAIEKDENKISKSPENPSHSSVTDLFCPIIRLSPPTESSLMYLIDFIWLPSPFDQYFLVAYSNSLCLLYKLSKCNKRYDLCQTHSIASTPKAKKISLKSLTDIVKLDYGQPKYSQENQQIYLPIFAIKTDGDIYCLYLCQQDIKNNSQPSSFIGPLRIYPTSYDNYGCRTTTMTCLKSSSGPTCLVYIRDESILNQSLVLLDQLLNKSIQQEDQQQHHETILYTIDSIILPESSASSQMLIIHDPLSDKRYYVADKSNIYSVDVEWLDDVKQMRSSSNFYEQKQMLSSKVDHLMTTTLTSEENKKTAITKKDKRDEKIKFMGLTQTENNGQWLCIITENDYENDKHIVLLRPNSAYLPSNVDRSYSCVIDKPNQHSTSTSVQTNDDFVQHIRSLLLSRDQNVPHLRLTNSQNAQLPISDVDFEKNLQKFISIFTNNYLSKQLRVQKELENKQRYLVDLKQKQLIASQELETKFNNIKHQSDNILETYSQERQRRKNMEQNLNDILSVIENTTPVLSEQELLMKEQLEKYHIQLKHLKTRTELVDDFIHGEQFDDKSLKQVQEFVQCYQQKIELIKQQLDEL